MGHASISLFILKVAIVFAILVALIAYFPLIGTIVSWIYLIGLLFATFFVSVGYWLLFTGRSDTGNVVFMSHHLASFTGDVTSVRMAIASVLSTFNLLLLWPIELVIFKWRLVHSPIGATELQGQFGHSMIYPLVSLKYLLVLIITSLLFVFDAPFYAVAICGVSAILWLITQTISATSLLTQLKISVGSVYARLWLIAAAQIAILVLFFAYATLVENPSYIKLDLIRSTFVELLVSPKGFVEAIADTSKSLVDLAKIGAGILMYITLISLLFRTSDFARSDDDWVSLATGQLLMRQPEKSLQALANVRNKGSQELLVRANALLMLNRFDEALDAVKVRNSVLGDIEEGHDSYAESALYLINNKSDIDLFHAFISYWMQNEPPNDAMLAMVLLSYSVYLDADARKLSDMLPEEGFPLSRALLHFNSIVTSNVEPDMTLIETALNTEYDNILDDSLCNIFLASLLIDGTFESEKPATYWLDRVLKNVGDLTQQQCSLVYDRMVGLTWVIEDEPPHSALKSKVLELKDALLGQLDPHQVLRLRAIEQRLNKHFQRKLLSD